MRHVLLILVRALLGMKRALLILVRVGTTSPSLRRKVRVSDIWKTPNYEAVEPWKR